MVAVELENKREKEATTKKKCKKREAVTWSNKHGVIGKMEAVKAVKVMTDRVKYHQKHICHWEEEAKEGEEEIYRRKGYWRTWYTGGGEVGREGSEGFG